jgi:SAM-dependent methyltransferase
MSEEDRDRWDRRWGDGSHNEGDPPVWLAELDAELPREGPALDLAAGAGRATLWLARRGLRVTALDVSAVGLERCRERAAREGLQVETRVHDLATTPLPAGPWALIGCFAYLQRELFPAMIARLAPGGVLACEITTSRNLERHARPSARFLVEPNELLRLAAPLEVVYYREGWLEGRARARLVARKDAEVAPPVL